MAVSWPAGVPEDPVTPMSRAPQSSNVQFEPDVGAPISRRRSTITPMQMDVTLQLLNETQRAAFEDWWHDTLLQGAEQFEWRDPVTGDDAIFSMPEPYQATDLLRETGRELTRITFTALRIRFV